MNLQDFILVLRAAQVGLQATVDELERVAFDIDNDSPEPKAPKVKYYKDYKHLSTDDLRAILLSVEPNLDTTGMSHYQLCTVLEEIRNKVAEPIIEMSTLQPTASGVFFPPGVVTDDVSTEWGKKLALWFDSMIKEREEVVRMYQRRMGCDLKCSRPGGACPNAVACAEALHVEDKNG
jgi:hypothetical protein